MILYITVYCNTVPHILYGNVSSYILCAVMSYNINTVL